MKSLACLVGLFLLSLLKTVRGSTTSNSLYKTLMQSLKTIQPQERQKKIREREVHDTRSLRLVGYRHLQPLDGIDAEEEEPDNAIFGGDDAHKGCCPWFVELLARNGADLERRCGGVMLSGNTLVTVANCLYTLNGRRADPTQSIAIVKRNEVAIGEGIERNWKYIREHPSHVYPKNENNIAVLTISGDPLYPSDDIGELNSDAGQPAANSSVTTVGFGQTKFGSGYSHTLQQQDFQILAVGTKPCKNVTNASQYMCADTVGYLESRSSTWSTSDEGDRDFCLGDEGAPLYRSDRVLYGLYMDGGTCSGQGDFAALVLRISFFRDWILDTACALSNTRCAASCSLLGGLALGMSSISGAVAGAAGAIWEWVSGPFQGNGGDEAGV